MTVSRQPNTSTPSGQPTANEYAAYLARRLYAGNHFTVFRDYLSVMSTDATLVVHSLLNLARGVARGEWVYCTREYLATSLYMARRTQDRVLRELQRRGFVAVRQHGLPAKRQVRIDTVAIERAITAAVPPGADDTPPPGVGGTELNHLGIPETNHQCKDKKCNHKTPRRAEALLGEAPGRKRPRRAPDSETGLPDAEAFAPTPPQATNVPPPTTGGAAPVAFTDEGNAGPPPGGVVGPTGSVREGGRDAPQPSFEKRSIEGVPVLDFPPSPKDRPRARTEQFDHDLWADIRRFVAAQRWPVTADRAKQAGAVAVMRRRLGRAGITPAQIRDVWAWYAANYTPAPRGVRGPLPVVRNAREFDRHWDWVTDRRNGKPHRPDGPAAPVTSEVQEIVANLSMRGWPKGAESQLPAVVAASVANLRGFLKRLAAAPLPRGASRSDVEAVEFVVGLVVGYAEQWWAGVWKQVHNWDEWRGDLAPWVWRPDHKAFVATVVTALDRRNGSGGAALYQSLLSAATPKERT